MVLKTFRHEYKYKIAYEEMLNLRKKLNGILNIDRDIDGYMVRSLYFDSINDIDYYEKLEGAKERKKIRLRIYEPNASVVKLEIKEKNDFHQLKESVMISKEMALELIRGHYEVLLDNDDGVSKKIYLIMCENCYKPKVIIEYKRIAYITSTTTRITFDMEIKKSEDVFDFFNEDINYIEVINKQDVTLEIKFDRFLEPYIADILKDYIVLNSSFSKYVLGRN